MSLIRNFDSNKSKVYAAEWSLYESTRDLEKFPKPVFTQTESDFVTRNDYVSAYNNYVNKYNEWVKNVNNVSISDIGSNLLDGTPAGAKKYIEEVVNSQWFEDAFGNGGPIGKPTFRVSRSKKVSGIHRLGMRGTSMLNEIAINTNSLGSEKNLLHEIAHYATAISNTERYEGHGAEFTRNYLYIVERVAGIEEANKLKEAFEGEKASIGDPIGSGVGSKGKTGEEIAREKSGTPQTDSEPYIGEQGRTGEEITRERKETV